MTEQLSQEGRTAITPYLKDTGWHWGEATVRTGKTHKDTEIKLALIPGQNGLFAIAALHEGKCAGVRLLTKQEDGSFRLSDGSSLFNFSVNPKGKGIGPALTAEAIEHAFSELGATKAIIDPATNRKWIESLVKKMGGINGIHGLDSTITFTPERSKHKEFLLRE